MSIGGRPKAEIYDELDGIATIYEITGDKAKVIETLDRKIACLKNEWGCKDGDAALLGCTATENETVKQVNIIKKSCHSGMAFCFSQIAIASCDS